MNNGSIIKMWISFDELFMKIIQRLHLLNDLEWYKFIFVG